MSTEKGITQWFGANLAELLSEKIQSVFPEFNANTYITAIDQQCEPLSYTQRIILHANELHNVLPASYPEAVQLLVDIMGEENPNETGMFKEYYRLMPVGKFIETYGLDHYDESIDAIKELTKRNTGEYAIRPYLRAYPEQTLKIMHERSLSDNFHLRRLASEGTRPKLPRSTKLDEFIDQPAPVFAILANLMEDEIKFVQKSVANNLTDYLKVNKPAAVEFIQHYQGSDNKHTQWVIKHATRKIPLD